ncbi:cytochrome P450 [Nocardia amamiensis]|uniref:cytochrome P450 n=1 Tax=Nocardia amamiensis TaxID=404578 RepID=UPI000B0FB678|nr:cytochrome P450 [Nocardia amamiensis]
MMQQQPAVDGAASLSIEQVGPRISLHTPEFASNPHEIYRYMRDNFGPLVPVLLAPGVPATLVISWHTARQILGDDGHFPADPRAWQDGVADDCPIKPMTLWRPNVLHAVGATHSRLREAINDALAGVDPHAVRTEVIWRSEDLIDGFCQRGRADVLGEFAHPMVFGVFNNLIGCSDDTGAQVADAMARMFNATNDTETVEQDLARALGQVVRRKRIQPGNDITTRLLTFPADPSEHAPLSDEETIHQLVLLYGAAIEPTVNLIANSVLHMITDDRFTASTTNVSSTITDAMTEVLAFDPPMANFCLTYPPRPTLVETQPDGQRIWLPANQPVLISLAACNNDPRIQKDRTANDSHLGWSTGRHACPKDARDLAKLIAHTGIERLLDAVPDLVPVNREPVWRPGPFHRAMAEFPVTFLPAPPMHPTTRSHHDR